MSESSEVAARIGIDTLAESIASGVLRALERRVDLDSHLAAGKSLVISPWITAGGRIELAVQPAAIERQTNAGMPG